MKRNLKLMQDLFLTLLHASLPRVKYQKLDVVKFLAVQDLDWWLPGNTEAFHPYTEFDRQPCTWLHHIFMEWTFLQGYKWDRVLNHEIALSQLIICSGHYGTLYGSVPCLVQITCPVLWSTLRIKLQHQATYNDHGLQSVSIYLENSWDK